MISEQVRALERRGVAIPCPESVDIGSEVRPERIAGGVIIHTGSRILGEQTSIGPDCEIGAEQPAIVENCQLGRGVALKGGYFSGATFLDGSNMGSGGHVRPGTLLEEEANGAHTVGLKQTLLFPFVTAGSLINFCDAFMAGGTSRKNHSEIGSSYIHFNFTPHQDKATASLLGDVSKGVMLDQPPIFLGGQGGLIGPVRIAYGTVIPAGLICRKDILDKNKLFTPEPTAFREPEAFTMGMYRSINRIVINNLIYIGNIRALQAWYQFVRRRFLTVDPFGEAVYVGALGQLNAIVDERLERLKELSEKMPRSLEKARAALGGILPAVPYVQQQTLIDRWPELETRLAQGPPPGTGAAHRDSFLEHWEKISAATGYLKAIGSLGPEARAAGTSWLQAIVDSVASLWRSV
ncbi:MAG TPA: UDP-N-acetylglucosamine pyrophosphorylase [Acidobacteriota bacterium]|nr:UDP-N-acetylglucosamine pyrophosphorylase [Acidobacteriota bacterium]